MYGVSECNRVTEKNQFSIDKPKLRITLTSPENISIYIKTMLICTVC